MRITLRDDFFDAADSHNSRTNRCSKSYHVMPTSNRVSVIALNVERVNCIPSRVEQARSPRRGHAV